MEKSEAIALQQLAGEKKQGVSSKASVIDLLERFPSVNISFADYLSVLPTMKMRQ